jgi:anti-anti-sigma regulatory factor
MIDVANGWIHAVERGPGWLFVRLNAAPQSASGARTLGDSIWLLAERHFVYRIVLECDDVPRLSETEVDELTELRQRLNAHGGTVRLCGLSPSSASAIDDRGLSRLLPHFDCREEAVLAHRPKQPR